MDYGIFDRAQVAHCSNGQVMPAAPYPDSLRAILSEETGREALSTIRSWPGYAPTPLAALGDMATGLGLGGVYYKDEGPRFGLGSFKALGGAYAVLKVLSGLLSDSLGRVPTGEEMLSGAFSDQLDGVTVATATDGNHGRSVAWGAQMLGVSCKIYMHAGVSQGRADAVEAFGAEVIWVDGNYDESVHQAGSDATQNGWHLISDTSYDGYMDIPRHVMAGYTVMAAEAAAQMPDGEAPTHVFLQGGVGGLAGAVCADFWLRFGKNRPRVIVVEPDRAPCLFASAVRNAPSTVEIEEETVMAGLSCGEVSLLAWDILSVGASDFLTIQDDLVAPVMCELAEGAPPIVAGESAVAGLAGLIASCRSEALKKALGLDETSRVMVFGTEGATDPVIYRELVGRAPEEIAA